MFEKIVDVLRRINRLIALIVGAVLALTVLFILADITLRQFGHSFGGSDEISGYVMAFVASWGLSFALLELAHVRIDLLRLKLAQTGRSILDLIAISATAAVTTVIAWQCWPVLAKSLERGSRANTPLETPLWIPQSIWFSGWVWFATASVLLLICAFGMLAQRQQSQFENAVGTATETEI
ncbi:TRAP transporter small permease subunit [Nitratireductor sp. CH_MIT9313-5]|jgi:TRAP-type C4-dicarboxylate transport system permease small subunit|uniref:TRAP transporter small permease subunit n=1 Tax=Nitratireductor sp. CH_MIT9313-5 TaxID=3107764 RepID=UPI003008233E